MKKTGYLILALIILILFVAFRQQYISVASENKLYNDTLYTESVPEPLDIEGIIEEYDSLITAEIKNTKTVGAAVAIVYKDQIAFLKCFGVRKTGEKDSINENTIFRLASVSKSVSGVLAGILANDSVIGLDDRVSDYIPGFRLKNKKYAQELTVRNLLSHTTGLVPHAYDDLVELKMPLGQIMNRLYLANMSAAPGQLYTYQNVMFSLYDSIVAAKTSKCYGDVMKEKLFEPFGMKDASTGFLSFRENTNKALPHNGGDGYFSVTKLNDRYYNTTPAAGVNASVSDMAHFLLTLLNDTISKVKNVEDLIFTPQIQTILSRSYFSKWDKVDSKEYGIGWRLVGYKGRKVAYHGGYVKGYRSEIALCKDEKIGIVYLSNSPSTIAARSVPEFLNRLFEFRDNQKTMTDSLASNNPDNKS